MLLTFRRMIGVIVLSCWALVSLAASSLTLYVGDRGLLSTPSPPTGAISQAAWASRHYAVSIVEQSAYGCTVKITEYFTGTAQVQCDYYYYWYDNYGYMHTNRATTYFNIYCKGVDIVLGTTSMTLKPGEGQYIDYRLSPTISPTPTVRFYSSNTNVATVSNSGYVRGVSSGNATITIECSAGPSKTCSVYVKQVNPTSVSIPSSLTAYVGESQSISATLYPSGAITTLSWYSTDNSIASVSSGRVTGKEEGTATIYTTTSNGLRSNDCTVTVKYRVPTGISLSSSTLYLPIGESTKLSCSVKPSNAKTTVSWSSDNTAVATVDDNGNVTALKAGKAVIKVLTDNGYWATCEVTVPPMPESIEISPKISLMYGKSRKINVVSQPADAYLSLTWTSDDSTVVTVDANGTVSARTPGVANVTATTSNGVSATCRVEVEEPVFNFIVWMRDEEKEVYSLTEKPQVTFDEQNIILTTTRQQMVYPKDSVLKFTMEDASMERMPESIELPQTLELAYKHQARLEYSLYPADYDIETTMVWTSDNPQVVSVDQSGVLTACGVGTALVTVTASNGCEASCLVQVPVPTYYFVVWLQEGGFLAYPFAENPVVTYEGELLVIATVEKEVIIEPYKVKKFTISDTLPEDYPSEVVPDITEAGMMYQGDDFVSFVGCRAYMDVYVYAINGMLVKTARTDAYGNLYLSLQELEKGIYIIKSEEITSKIMKR